MALQRLDVKSVRYDRFSHAVLIDGRKCVVEVSVEALEAISNRSLEPEAAVDKAVAEIKRLTWLASRLPADDGKIHITANLLLHDGMFAEEDRS